MKKMHDNKPLSPFLIYSNGPYGISTVTSISGTVLIFNIVVRELHTHADIFRMIADFHSLETSFSETLNLLKQFAQTRTLTKMAFNLFSLNIKSYTCKNLKYERPES